jgi:hypothetical protein
LGWRELVICDQKRESSLNLRSEEFTGLPCANVCVWVCVTPLLPLCTNNLSPRGAREAGKLFKTVNRWPASIFAGVYRNKEGAFYWWRNRDRCSLLSHLLLPHLLATLLNQAARNGVKGCRNFFGRLESTRGNGVRDWLSTVPRALSARVGPASPRRVCDRLLFADVAREILQRLAISNP